MHSRSVARRLLPAGLVVLAAAVLLRTPSGAVVAAQEVQTAPAGVLSFTDVTAAAGMASALTGSHGAFWADATGDGRPDLFITYHRSSAIEGPSVYVVKQRPDDPLNTVSSARLFQASTGTYTYDGALMLTAAPDPLVADGVWAISQTGIDAGSFQLNVAQARTATGDTYVPLPSTRVLDTRPGGTGLAGPFSANVPRTFGVAGVLGIPAGSLPIADEQILRQWFG
jgi:hypothetical protein